MTNTQMAKCFNEWMRRFIDQPDQFEREFEQVNEFVKSEQNGIEPTYGETCAVYMEKLSGELRAEQ